MRSPVLGMLLLSLICLVSGCGGGGGGATGSGPTATTATVVIKTVGAPTTLYGVQFKVQIPTGVTLATEGAGVIAAGVMIPSGGATGGLLEAGYQSSNSPQTATVSVTHGSGFQVGEFMTMTVTVPPGTVLLPADLVLSEFKAYDNFNGIPTVAITGTATVL